MAKLEEYRQYIQQVLTDYAQRRTSHNKDDELEMQTVFDTMRDHYQLIYVGWDKGKRVFGPVMHLDIKNGKIWIQWNGTEDDIAMVFTTRFIKFVTQRSQINLLIFDPAKEEIVQWQN